MLPVVNENDTIATNEIKVGDNDTLSAMTAVGASADLLILLSDIDGLFTADPHKNKDAVLLHTVKEITKDIEDMVGGAGSDLGTGGMATKIKAAKIATQGGTEMVIANGDDPMKLYDIVAGLDVGTRFFARKAD